MFLWLHPSIQLCFQKQCNSIWFMRPRDFCVSMRSLCPRVSVRVYENSVYCRIATRTLKSAHRKIWSSWQVMKRKHHDIILHPAIACYFRYDSLVQVLEVTWSITGNKWNVVSCTNSRVWSGIYKSTFNWIVDNFMNIKVWNRSMLKISKEFQSWSKYPIWIQKSPCTETKLNNNVSSIILWSCDFKNLNKKIF